jgi:hypothetical protein
MVIFVLVFAIASNVSVTLDKSQQALAKSPSKESMMEESMKDKLSTMIMGNLSVTKGIVTLPIQCINIGDLLNATLSGISGGMANGDGNETNSIQELLMNATKQGMDEVSQAELQQLSDVVFCNLSSEDDDDLMK